MNFGDCYFTKSQYNKLILFIRIEEILLLLMFEISCVLIITFMRKKKTHDLIKTYKYLAIPTASEYVFVYVENRIFKRGSVLSPLFPGKEYVYHLDRFLLTGLFYTMLFSFIFIICFLYFLLKIFKKEKERKILRFNYERAEK